jgi:hypothetical protein
MLIRFYKLNTGRGRGGLGTLRRAKKILLLNIFKNTTSVSHSKFLPKNHDGSPAPIFCEKSEVLPPWIFNPYASMQLKNVATPNLI